MTDCMHDAVLFCSKKLIGSVRIALTLVHNIL